MRLSERKKQRRQRQLIMRFLLFATLFRLFLFWQTPLSYWTEQVYDDQLMYHYADSLADFQWLGDYEITADEVLGGIAPKANKMEQAKRLLRPLINDF